MIKTDLIKLLIAFMLMPGVLNSRALAQSEPDVYEGLPPADEELSSPSSAAPGEVEQIERELEKNIPAAPSAPEIQPSAQAGPMSSIDFKESKPEKLFSDTVVIQKNYMPKTKRFQFYGAITYSPNDIFFDTYGINARGDYFFSEAFGIELEAFFLKTNPAKVVKTLESNQSVSTDNLVTPSSFMGVSAYFSSIYGKTAVFDRNIVPFEIYETIGIGKMNTTSSVSSDALKLSVGQLFSLNRNSSVRIDLGIYFYQSKTVQGEMANTNSMFLNVGYQGLFPAVGRR